MLMRLLLLFMTAQAAASAPLAYKDVRLGAFEATEFAGFGVAVDEQRDVIHFVHRGLHRQHDVSALAMYHTMSVDGGMTWSEGVLVDAGQQVDLALDGAGNLHIVYGHEMKGAPRYPANVLYRVYRNGQWSDARRIDGSDDSRVYQMRIAVDGADNVHILYHDEGPAKHYPGSDKDDWRDDRVVYVRKSADGGWEPVQRWSGNDEHEGCLGGDIFIDPAGDAHFVYMGGNSENWHKSLEWRARRKTGEWGPTLNFPNMALSVAGMMRKFGGQLDANGTLFLGGIAKTAGKVGVKVWAVGNADVLPNEVYFDPRSGRGIDLLLDPSGNGDIWVTGGNWQLDAADTGQAFYYRYSASTRQWSERMALSPLPPAAVNVETFWDTAPRLRAYKGRVCLFYSEKKQGENARFYMRVFEPATPISALAPAGDRASHQLNSAPAAPLLDAPPAPGSRVGRLSVATCQFPISADVRANGEWVRRQMREARTQGADLAHFAECALSGYAGADHPTLENFDWDVLRAETESVLALARELSLWVVLGSTHPLTGAHKPHNSLYVITPEGRILDRYDKRFCVGADLKRYSPGDHFTVFEVNGVRCGLLICFDVRFPELYREYVKLGVRLMFQSFYNARQRPEALSPIVVPATAQGHAANNFMFMSLANSSAPPAWPSRFITPDGIIAAAAPADEPAVMVNLVDTKKRYYDASRSFRLECIDGKLNTGRTVDDPRSRERTSY